MPTASSTARSNQRTAMFAASGGRADQARADRHHAAEGEGPASGRREAGHARPSAATCMRAARRSPSCATRRWSRSCSTCWARATRPAQRRLHPRAQGRLPLRRQRAGRRDRVRRPRRRCARAGFRPGAGAPSRGAGRGLSSAAISRYSRGRLRPPFLLWATLAAISDKNN